MEKTKLGLSASLFAAILFCAAYFGGYVAAIIIAGYILIAEESVWLKKMALRCLLIMIAFSVISLAINFVPDLIKTAFSGADYDSIGRSIYNAVAKFSNIQSEYIYYPAKIVVFVLMIIASLRHSEKRVFLIDKLFDKHFC